MENNTPLNRPKTKNEITADRWEKQLKYDIDTRGFVNDPEEARAAAESEQTFRRIAALPGILPEDRDYLIRLAVRKGEKGAEHYREDMEDGK